MINVLLTDANYKHTLGACRFLKKAGYAPFIMGNGFCESSNTVAGRIELDLLKEECIDELLKEIIRLNIQVFIPIGAKSVRNALELREHLSQFCYLALPDENAANLAFSKQRTLEYAKSIGVKTPNTALFPDFSSIKSKVKEFKLPIVVKGANEITKCEPQYFNSVQSVLEFANQKYEEENLVVQERVAGNGEGFFAIYQHGELKRFFMHQRIRENPPSGGASTCARSIYKQDLFENGKAILDGLNWHGVAMVEFKRDLSGQLYLMEVNPKFWGSLDLSLSCGVNFPECYVKVALGKKLNYDNKYVVNKKCHWPLDGEFEHFCSKPISILPIMIDTLNPLVKSNISIFDILPSICRLKNILRKLGRRLWIATFKR